MSVGRENIPSSVILKNQKEVLTPHILTIGVLIKEFNKIRENAMFCTKRRQFIREICVLILKLIQSPDLSFEELNALINSLEYSLCKDSFIEHFHATTKSITTGIGALQDIVDAIGQLIPIESQLSQNKLGSIARNSVVGFYLRRIIINFDRLSFSEISAFLKSYQKYCLALVNGKLENISSYTNAEKCKKFEYRHWTQRQAELFIATQSSLLVNNQEKAYPPQELHKYTKGILKSNPDLAAAHFLNYLNYLRVKEYCGAIESLFHCFDKSTSNEKATPEDTNKCYRYATLNLAILHCQFGQTNEGLLALKESIKMAQEAGDTLCLQHALRWLRCLKYNQQKLMAENSLINSTDLSAYEMSLQIQSFAKWCGLTTLNPQLVFDSLTSSDVISSQYCHGDLISTSFGLKAGLWLFYGKAEMCSLWSQLLLNLNSDNLQLNKAYYGTSHVHALCNIAGQMHLEGEYIPADAVLSYAEKRFSKEPMTQSLILCRNLFNFQRYLFNEEVSAAEVAAVKIAIVDKWESKLCLAYLNLMKENYTQAHSYVSHILEEGKDSLHKIRMDVEVRAMLLLADIQIATAFPGAAIPGIFGLLNSAVAFCMDFNMHYLAALAQLHIAHVLLLMKMPQQASKILDRCMIKILTDGGRYDRARALLLHVLCKVACSAQETSKERRHVVIKNALEELLKVQQDFEKIEARFRVKDVLLLRAKLADEIGNLDVRNKCAFDFRSLHTEYPNIYGSKLCKLI